MVHRDIKPGNILFDAEGNPHISDFGIAKVTALSRESHSANRHTQTGMVMGTPDYMAPELIMGQSFDGKVDQFALGMTVYEVLTGRLPFPGLTPAAILVKQTMEVPPALDTIVNVCHLLSQAIEKSISKQSKDRFESCTDFSDAVNLALGHPDGLQVGQKRAPSKVMTKAFACPRCLKPLSFTNKHSGRIVLCPKCRTNLKISPDMNQVTPVVPGSTSSRSQKAVYEPKAGPEPNESHTSPVSMVNLEALQATVAKKRKKVQVVASPKKRSQLIRRISCSVLVAFLIVFFVMTCIALSNTFVSTSPQP
jgi:serine/threonine-protein kinase